MAWDPRDDGARCDVCWLRDHRDGGPVPPEKNGNLALILGESPGADEVAQGRPFVGRSGQKLFSSIHEQGLRRDHFTLDNVLACRPRGDKLKRAINDYKKAYATRLMAQPIVNGVLVPPDFPSPIECCAPRVAAQVARFRHVLGLGGQALQAVLGKPTSIMAVRGGPITLPTGQHFLPTMHPAFVLRSLGWSIAFACDIGRAMRWFRTGKLEWVEPRIKIRPSPQLLRDWLYREDSFTSWDIETEWLRDSPLTRFTLRTRIRCLGFSDSKGIRSLVVPLLSVDQTTTFYSPDELREILDTLWRWLEDDSRAKAGWNSGYFDTLAVRAQFPKLWKDLTGQDRPPPVPRRNIDLILGHRCVDSEVPHSLGYAASTLTDAPAWKQEHTATQAKTDEELWKYNGKDTAITSRLQAPIYDGIDLRGARRVFRIDHRVQEICRGLHEAGMLVDQRRRAEYDKKFLGEALERRKACRELAENPKLNPNSFKQIADLLYRRWRLPEVKVNEDSGAPSTDDEALRELMFHPAARPKQVQFIDQLRRFRTASKLRGTYITKLRPMLETFTLDELMDDVEDRIEGEGEDDREERLKKEVKKCGIVHPDGRVHADYNAHSVVTRRLSSSSPNCQNFPSIIRDLVVPAPGRIFVYADKDQLELRGVANFAGAKNYIEVFLSGADPHAATALHIFGKEGQAALEASKAKFGDAFKKHPESPFKRMRDFAKCVVGSTLVMVPGQGPVRIDALGKTREPGTFEPCNAPVIGLEGRGATATHFYCGGVQDTYRISTRRGACLEGTGNHRLLAMQDWLRLDELCVGDLLVTSPDLGLDEVVSIERGRAEVFDLSVPVGHAFAANGLVNHNTFVYASVYSAGVKTIHEIIKASETTVEDPVTGKKSLELVYRNLPLNTVRERHRSWLDANPEIEEWWGRTLEVYRRQGYIEEPVHGWRRYFSVVEDEDKDRPLIVNFAVQASGAAQVHDATIALVDGEIPFGKWGPGTGLVQQGHDALVFEVPLSEARRLCDVVTEAMTQRVKGHPIPYTAEAHCYVNWRDEACGEEDDFGGVCLLPGHEKRPDKKGFQACQFTRL